MSFSPQAVFWALIRPRRKLLHLVVDTGQEGPDAGQVLFAQQLLIDAVGPRDLGELAQVREITSVAALAR